ncbi:MAG: type III pantothenate kinase [Pseudohongiellaceae bacterium]
MGILEIDIGNSRIKWRRFADDRKVVTSRGINLDIDGFLAEQANHEKPSAVRLSNVSDTKISSKIADWAGVNWNIQPIVAVVCAECSGVKIQYKDVSRLGVDRWLAMLAAYNQSDGPCLIIDSGTAFTLDVINEEGLHLGGYILPGLRLMRESLVSKTGIRLADQALEPRLELGNSTQEAVFNGGVASLVALAEKEIEEQRKKGFKPDLFITGGDASVLDDLLAYTKSKIAEDLVLDGLSLGCHGRTGFD